MLSCRIWWEDNIAKAAELASSFFPLPPATTSIPENFTYPASLKGICFHSRDHIHQVIKVLNPYKAPGPDKIPNIVYIKCIDSLISHLFYIFRALFALGTYHSRWLEIMTLVLWKIGKTNYNIVKSY
jgi:hypothetical protein